MKKYAIPGTDLEVSRIPCGCIRIGGSWADEVELTREEWNALFIAGRGGALP